MDSLLYGHSKEERIVSVQPLNDSAVRLYKRSGNSVIYQDAEFFPFFHLSDSRFISDFKRTFWLKKLEGKNFYRYVCAFPGMQDMWNAVRFIIEKINQSQEKKITSYTETEHIFLRSDTSTQYLLQSGKTLFKGMDFSDIYRMQLDIETYSKNYTFSNAERIEDRIILISLSDNRGWETVLGGKSITEKELLGECIKIIHEKDPDVIEGHNIFNFDLPYIIKRCELHSIEFAIGRDSSPPRGLHSRTSFAEHEIDYTSYDIAGRHVVDTWLLVQAYDVSKRNMESYGLKYAAKYFGVAPPQRIYIPGEKISWYWDNEPDVLKHYALDDVRETRAISERLSIAPFYLTQMLPFNYGVTAKLGAAAKIESLFVRHYLKQRFSLPKPETGFQTTGGYTEIFYTGVLGPIVHADVESLYPSIMLSKNIYPATDELKIFNQALRHLTKLRLNAKKEMKIATDPADRSRLDALQSSFKILINSFYGYLGYSKGIFNDYAKADLVTTTGQTLLKRLIHEINLHNGTVVEVDTDGIFFVVPDNVHGDKSEHNFVEHLSESLPEGIRLDFSGRYKKILSYKKKNYALVGYDNKIIIKGSSLISRSMERFGRSYIQQCIDYILDGRIDDLHKLYLTVERSIRDHAMDVKDFARTESLKDSINQYLQDVKNEKRNKTASYEVALRSSRDYTAGDKISFYFTGNDANIRGFENAKGAEEWDPNFPDENTTYYLKRLEEFSKKFEPFFTEKDFRAIFSSEDLFGFDASHISVLSSKVRDTTEAEREWQNPNIAISLDV
jgi:DNA polymerase, archaea type